MGGGLRLPKSFYERPLTPKEAQFATDNINIVWWYLDKQGLNRSEWFDVVIFRYLLAVKRWFALPDLQKVKFVTVACQAMRSAIGHDREKRAKEPQTVSLYEAMVKFGVDKFESDVLNLTLVKPTNATSIDSAKLKKKYPDIASECSKTTAKAGYVKITLKGDKS